ncbi:sugar ABC transporter ATP-binding protein [Shewanella schlegeliana]|uniref:Sugar ABC transporter ATP-binding protein n=1 Tax=Shewanella schlegeliana TaxID=190308 RepID=A0ABS1SU73_9GAMM|nr:sugar ABC transporter ATP-binding protein [Shewanella schlegeliana]MBL4912097.1 sugar ABC transporter ATP-binding protein [Shewanella schlegeliana]MCL1111305.1 sugar ABC transporter ATP-binding protein [Shewanella schlegeliana]GIU32948.1 enolase [Shewanella schlegeliana]
MTNTPLLSVKSIKKSFGEVKALKHINFTLNAGEIHALCGGNGAGKSTFLSIVMGFLQPDEGSIMVNGESKVFANAKEALQAGITIVQQELSMIPNLTVAENIYLGQEPRNRFGVVDFKTLNQRAQTLMDELEFDIPVNAMLHTLSVAHQQLVEIAKALSHSNANIIFLDEPTSAIGEEDSKKLFNAIKSLAAKGKGIVYVSHRLSEIFEICSHYTVFRDGTYISEGLISDINRDQLIEQIIGGQINEEFSKFNQPTEQLLLEVKNLTSKKFNDISFKVNKGEILGIYGLVGSGRSEVLNAIFGVDEFDTGSICLNDSEFKKIKPKQAINAGMAYVTEDRKSSGLVLSSSVGDNISISSLEQCSNAFVVNEKRENERIEAMIELFRVKTPNKDQIVGNLSGGNQQKVVLGRWSLTNPELLMLDEPTRGIDVGAKKEIYRYMSEQALQGKGIIMVSSELPEIIGMSDRIIVFKNGELISEVTQSDASQQLLLSLAS